MSAILAAGCSSSDEPPTQQAASELTQAEIRAGYESWPAREATARLSVEQRFGKSFAELDESEYRALLGTLDFENDDDAWITWSLVAEVPVTVLTRDSNFTYYNAHLVDEPSADKLRYGEYSEFESRFDKTKAELILLDAAGQARPTIPAASGAIRATSRSHGVSYNAGFALDTLNFAVLERYLAPLSSIPKRREVSEALKALPQGFVRLLRGKAIMFSTASGRSYTVGMPVSNDIYELFAGLMPGAYVENNSARQIPETFVHELCHVIDNSVIERGYGNFLYPVQFPAVHAKKSVRDAAFGHRTERSTERFGFVSAYAKTNDAEDFAESCRLFVRDRATFESMASDELAAGHPELKTKLDAMVEIFSADPASLLLSEALLDEWYEKDQGGSSGGGSSGGGGVPACADDACRDARCLEDFDDVAREIGEVAQVLGVSVDCASSDRVRVGLEGADYYYAGKLTCRMTSPPSAERVASFTSAMEAKGFYGFRIADEGGAPLVRAGTSTRRCSSY